VQDAGDGTRRYELSFPSVFAPTRPGRQLDIFLYLDNPRADGVDGYLPNHVLDLGREAGEGGEGGWGSPGFEDDAVVDRLHCGPGGNGLVSGFAELRSFCDAYRFTRKHYTHIFNCLNKCLGLLRKLMLSSLLPVVAADVYMFRD
jgi:hypothetical protein